MPTLYEIPLSAAAQTFSVSLAGVTYNMLLTYREAGGAGWCLDLSDASDNPLICGLPLVTGTDLLGQFGYLGIGGSLVVYSDGDMTAIPTFYNLGDTSHLVFITYP